MAVSRTRMVAKNRISNEHILEIFGNECQRGFVMNLLLGLRER